MCNCCHKFPSAVPPQLVATPPLPGATHTIHETHFSRSAVAYMLCHLKLLTTPGTQGKRKKTHCSHQQVP